MQDIDIEQISPEQIEEAWPFLSEKERAELLGLLEDSAIPKPKCELYQENADPVDWITSHFYIPELKSPIWLADYQKQALQEALKKDETGKYKYSLVIWSDRKKSAKTSISSAFAAYYAFTHEWENVKFVGQKLDQAKSRAFYYLTRMLRLNPLTNKMIASGEIIVNKYEIILVKNNTSIRAIPANPSTEAGGNDGCIVWTEIGLAHTEAAQSLWSELVIPPAKFGKGIKWAEGYAGVKGRSIILEPLYDAIVKPEKQIHADYPFYADGRTFVLWNGEEDGLYLPWQTQSFYQQQSKELTPSEFDRIHMNKFVAGTEGFITDVWWNQLEEDLPALTSKEKIVLGVDAAVSDDCFAIVGVTKHPTKPEKYAVRLVRVWKPKNGRIFAKNPNPEHPEMDVLYPWGFVKDLCSKYKVVIAAYDPHQLEHFAQQMNSERICYWKPFPQGEKRLRADKMLYDMIINAEVAHNGDKSLREHVLNANAEMNKNQTIRLVKRSKDLKIDAAVAMSMALYEARQIRL